MKNFHLTYENHENGGHLWRGGAPKSKEDLQQLHTIGIRTIVSLQSGFADSIGDYPEEARDWLEMGGRFVEVKCSNFWAPTREQTAAVLDELNPVLNGKSVYIHCFSGVDRTGWMCAAWKLAFKPVEDSWHDEAWNKGMHKWFFWWKPIFMWRYRA